MQATPIDIIGSEEMGKLAVFHLKRFWHKNTLIKQGVSLGDISKEEWGLDMRLLAALGLGLEQVMRHVYNSNLDFESFEDWVLEVNNGKLDQENIKQFNQTVQSGARAIDPDESGDTILSEADIDFWNENGYVIIRNAITKEDCENTINAICEYINIDRYNSETWYNPHPAKQGIMVQLFQHPVIEKNRNSVKVRKAYEQLWQRKDIWINADRVGFNPPETAYWKFPGPRIHWDVSIKQPIPFGLQGILYLSDTAADQGAFSLIPGFHNKIGQWLETLPPNTNPREVNFYELGVTPLAANAGDFIIWHHALPHGSSINSSDQPRYVQYMNYEPLDSEKQSEWI